MEEKRRRKGREAGTGTQAFSAPEKWDLTSQQTP